MSSSINKRLLKELRLLTIQQHKGLLLENDYLVSFDESNLSKVYCIIKGPYDSLYRHKFIRLDFDIPQDYPFSPPKVSFLNYDASRIHPTLYEDSRVCCTILNTWPSLESSSKTKLEAWTSSFGIETIILTFLSFLDNEPYTYEASAPNNESYNTFVLHQTWHTCLIKYLESHNNDQPIFTNFIHNYMLFNINDIMSDLDLLNNQYPPDAYHTSCFYIGYYTINYNIIINNLSEWYNYIDYKDNYEVNNYNIDYNTFINTNYTCNICFDTQEYSHLITLNCNHQFHTKCINTHIINNGNICSLCRTDITENILHNIQINTNIHNIQEWIINPETKRRIKIGGKTYNRLLDDGLI